MLKEAFKGEDMKYDENTLDFKTLFIMGIATSLDSLLVGLTLAILPFHQTLLYTIKIGIITFIISGIGFILGNKTGDFLGNKSHFIGAFLLLFIAIKTIV